MAEPRPEVPGIAAHTPGPRNGRVPRKQTGRAPEATVYAIANKEARK